MIATVATNSKVFLPDISSTNVHKKNHLLHRNMLYLSTIPNPNISSGLRPSQNMASGLNI